LEKFRQVIEAQGGDVRVLESVERLPRASKQKEVAAWQDGYVERMESLPIGRAAMLLGAGRQKAEDSVDPAVGVEVTKKVGDPVSQGETLATLSYNGEEALEEATRLVEGSFSLKKQPPSAQPLVLEVIRGK
jgi:thymidine phosphorylase